MTGSLNKVMLIGNLGRDPEVRTTGDGNKLVTLNIATSESWKDKNTGERKERTEWHRVVIFSPGLATVAEQYLKKGSKVFVEGQLQTRKWQDQQGQDKYSTEVVLRGFSSQLAMLDGRSGGGAANDQIGGQMSGQMGPADDFNQDYGNPGSGSSGGNSMQATGTTGTSGPAPEMDDEIPF